MDYNKKKLLSQSVGFLQGHLTLTTEFLVDLKDGGILTREEVSIIQKDDTTSGKVLELVCLLKRKDSRSYSKFLQILEKHNFTAVAAILKTKGSCMSDNMLPDPRTLQYLEQQLGGVNVNPKLTRDLAVGLVLKEIYQDDVNALEDKLTGYQKITKSRVNRDGSSLSDEGYATPPRLKHPESPKWDIPTKSQDLEDVIREKDVIIRRKDDEYSKLKVILEETQNDLQSLLDLNNQYLGIISQLNSMQINVGGGRHEADTRQIAELNRKLEESQVKVEELTVERDHIHGELANTQRDVDKLSRREVKYKEMLGLDGDADDRQIERRIKDLMKHGDMQKGELEKITKELKEAKASRASMEERLNTLVREKDKVEFHLRQQDLTLKRMKRMKTASDTISKASIILSHGTLPTIECQSSQISLMSAKNARRGGGPEQELKYCVFCRSEYHTAKPSNCRMHHQPLRNGIWTCCRDECHRSVGCLHVPHFFVQVTADRKIFLTDGARYMEIT